MTATMIVTDEGQSDLPHDRNLLAALGVACAIVRDLDGTIRFWSAGAESLYGWSPQDAVGRRSHDLLATQFPQPLDDHPCAAPGRGGLAWRTAAPGAQWPFVDLAAHWAVQRGPDGRPNGIVEINNDTSFQQQGMAAIRRLAAIVELSNDAIIGKTLDGIVNAWNRAAEAMFGWRAEEIVGQPITLLFPPGRAAEELDIIARIRRGEKVKRYETVRRRKDGSTSRCR